MSHDQDAKRAWDLIERIGLCMLVTHDGSGDELRARPMSAHADRYEGTVYFLTDARNHKDDEIEVNENVCLAFAEPSGSRYVSVTGTARVSDSRALVDKLWSTAAKAWWDSKDDPNIRVLRVVPSMAEFWDGPGMIVSTVKMAAAAITGTRPDLGENRKVAL